MRVRTGGLVDGVSTRRRGRGVVALERPRIAWVSPNASSPILVVNVLVVSLERHLDESKRDELV